MRLDDNTIELFKIRVVDDPLGGYTNELVSLGTIEGLVSPASNELSIGANNQIVMESIVKLYTMQDIPQILEVKRVMHNDILYAIKSFKDYGTIKYFQLVEA